MTSLGIIPVTSPQPRGIIIPIVSENLPSKVKRKALGCLRVKMTSIHIDFFLKMKALPMPLLCIEGTANFPYQILLVSFHLQYRNAVCIKNRKSWHKEEIGRNLGN